MKKNKNNSYLYAFYNSGYFLPFIIFFIFVIINHLLFFQKNFFDYDWRFILAFFGGCNHDLFIFSFVTLILAFICKLLPILKKPSVIILYLFLLLPAIDYLYFRATLERFNWVVLQFINYHSAKGYIGNMGTGVFYIFFFLLFITIACYYSFKKEKFAEPYSLKLLASICIFSFFASFFTNNITFKLETNFTGHMKVVEGKNRILNNLSSGSILGFIKNTNIARIVKEFKPYATKEKAFLEQYGIIPRNNNRLNDFKTNNKEVTTSSSSLRVVDKTSRQSSNLQSTQNNQITNEPIFNKVIMIVLESFALEYIHAINPDIPAEASPYLDYLVGNYPHLTNYYTSDFPSLQGFNVLLSSKIPFIEQNHNKQSYNLASMLEQKSPNSTWFLRGSSRVYGNEEIAVKNIFGFSHLIGYEDLAITYQEPEGYVWGYKDSILYDKAFNILSNKDNSVSLMVIKLLNQHQPIFQYIINAPNQPQSVLSHNSDIVKAIYNADKEIKEFITRLETNSIVDEKTLVIITADHYPPLGYGHTKLIKSESNFQLGKLPLIFYSKQNDIFKNLKSDTLSCQLDISPTLCYLLGLEIPGEHMGQNLLSPDFKPRSIGILNNERLFFQSEILEFSENLTHPATSTTAIKKWINNLLAN